MSDVVPDPKPARLPEPEAEWESEGGAVLPPGVTVVLRGPEGATDADLEQALEAARTALPEGFRLERD
ncbi:MAG TPA: hypothetical protein VIC63_00825 [Candidatus Limnocylindria bacterium]|jgi:hypothetical protein